MKKWLIAIICILFIVPVIAACSAGSVDSADSEHSVRDESNSNMSMPDVNQPPADGSSDNLFGSSKDGSDVILSVVSSQDFAEKIIYTYRAGIETLNFEDTIDKLNSIITLHNAFIENSNIIGSDYTSSYNGRVRMRSAAYVIRIPVAELNAVTAKLDTLGYVVNQSSFAENITSQFTDTQSRLNSLRVQEERLLDMLSKAEDIPTLLTIESNLADIRYQIERLTSTLANWQRQVDYSTLELSITEVEEYREPPPPVNRTYWEKMSDGFINTMKGVGDFFMGLFLWLVVSSPVLVILAVIIILIVFIVKKQMRKSRGKYMPIPPRPVPATPGPMPAVSEPPPPPVPLATPVNPMQTQDNQAEKL